MAQNVPVIHKVGPLLLLIAEDPTAPNNWTFLGPTDGDTKIIVNTKKNHGGHDLYGMTKVAGSTYAVGFETQIQAALLDESRDMMAAVLGAQAEKIGTDGLSLRAGLAKMTEPFMFAIPWDEAGNDAANKAAKHAWLFMAVDLTNAGDITRNVKEGKNTNPRTTTWDALLRPTWPLAPNTVLDYNYAYRGPVADLPAPFNTIVFPDLSGYVLST